MAAAARVETTDVFMLGTGSEICREFNRRQLIPEDSFRESSVSWLFGSWVKEGGLTLEGLWIDPFLYCTLQLAQGCILWAICS